MYNQQEMNGQLMKPQTQHIPLSSARRVNLVALWLTLMLPWSVFCLVFAVLIFSVRYSYPMVAYGVVVLIFLLVVLLGVYAFNALRRRWTQGGPEATWFIFLFLTTLLAYAVALFLADLTYRSWMQPYYDVSSLNQYDGVDVTTYYGQQLMDAGIANFSSGTELDTSRPNAFKNDVLYCVAPLTSSTYGGSPLTSYDFWAVGTNCCSDDGTDFACGSTDSTSLSGIRVMENGDRSFYRLAVQEAISIYGISSVHPLFFTLVDTDEATEHLESYYSYGSREYFISMLSYFVFQSCLVMIAACCFVKKLV